MKVQAGQVWLWKRFDLSGVKCRILEIRNQTTVIENCELKTKHIIFTNYLADKCWELSKSSEIKDEIEDLLA